MRNSGCRLRATRCANLKVGGDDMMMWRKERTEHDDELERRDVREEGEQLVRVMTARRRSGRGIADREVEQAAVGRHLRRLSTDGADVAQLASRRLITPLP